MQLRLLAFDHPDSLTLTAAVQREYVVRYGEEDVTPVEPAQFAPPNGLFAVGYLDDRPVACGGWRRVAEAEDGVGPDDAELKRMFVLPDARGRGLARSLLVYLEVSARDAGCHRMVLETGTEQPEAMALYRSEGYEPIPNFGTYREHPLSRCFAKSLLDVAGLPAVG